MTICSVVRSNSRSIGWSVLFFSAFVLTTIVSFSLAEEKASLAEEKTDPAESMLENLKRRSAEERWQRVKKQYPTDPSSPRRNSPSRLPLNHQQTLTEDEVEPRSDQTSLIPRLTAVPSDVSNDWIRPARQPVVDIDDVVPAPSHVQNTKETKSTLDPLSTRSAVRVAVEDTGTNPKPQDRFTANTHRSVHERQISEISPFYDRTRDSDIREFAVQKGKEMDIQFKSQTYTERIFPEITLAWEASNLTYYPLYFSDPALERYGHSHHPIVQPFASIARAGVQFVLLPYQMTINPPCKEESPLGWYRPGECAPKLHYQIPLNAEAAVVEAAAVTGLFFIIMP